ncbi:unnamed protein product [Amoebophrya sp. A120]|nr:unnamed protein product [Amoebophrya sp. A120]|eukprot:GSA120T00018999001.1
MAALGLDRNADAHAGSKGRSGDNLLATSTLPQLSAVDSAGVDEETLKRRKRLAELWSRGSMSAELDRSWKKFQLRHENFTNGLVAQIGMSFYDPDDVFKQYEQEQKEQQKAARLKAEAESVAERGDVIREGTASATDHRGESEKYIVNTSTPSSVVGVSNTNNDSRTHMTQTSNSKAEDR